MENNFFYSSEVDHSLYTKKVNTIIYILIWVADSIISASNDTLMNETKSLLKARFKMTDLGTLNWFLGIDFKVEKDSITMSQSAYLKYVLSKFEKENCKGVKTPCDKFIIDEERSKISCTEYRSAAGSLIYAMVCARPDLMWILTKLSQ